MNWEEQHERAMQDPRVRGEESDAVAPGEAGAEETDLSEETTAARHGIFPPDLGTRNELGGGAEDQEALDEEFRR